MQQLELIISIASHLNSALSAQERYRRLLSALRRVIPYDASTLLRLEGEELVPIVAEGLSEDALGRRFALAEHPRLQIICRSSRPVLFPADSELPDPFDGLLVAGGCDFERVHSCLGCPLRMDGELIGALTADARRPRAFDEIEPDFLAAVGALAAAEMRTTHLIEALENSARRQGRIARDLMRDVQARQGEEMIGTSPAMRKLRREIELVARSDLSVLIEGETGTGKELAAAAVHAESNRGDEPMLYVNCAALPETLADSELFGHVRGAFTGASSDRPGKLEVASGGTLLLDEIGELPLTIQPKLLRALQQGEIQRVGSDRNTEVDVRVIAATNRDLERAVAEGSFRADLFHRLNVFPLRVPPLRERAGDIPLLAGHFCETTRRKLGLGPLRIAPDAIEALQAHAWPGNVRELENVISRVALEAMREAPRGEPLVLRAGHLGPELGSASVGAPGERKKIGAREVRGIGLRETTRRYQRATIERCLEENDGNWSATARDLKMHRSNLHHLAVRLGLK